MQGVELKKNSNTNTRTHTHTHTQVFCMTNPGVRIIIKIQKVFSDH